MADKKTDHNAYQGFDAKLVRGIDAAQDSAKAIWDKASLNRGAYGALAAALGCAVVAAPLTIYQEVEEHQRIPHAEIAVDYDLSAKGLHNKTYSYIKYSDGENTPIYLLINDEVHYELYSWADDRNRAELLEDKDIAEEIVAQVSVYLAQQSHNFESSDTRFYPCEALYEASETEDGNGVIRKETSCKTTEPSQTGLRNAAFFWQQANENIASAPYGPASITEQPDLSGFEDIHALQRQGQNTLWAMGAWLALSSVGAGISGLRRKVKRKQQKANRF